MGYNRFAIIIVFRITLILINLWVLTYLFSREDLFYTLFFLVLALLAQIWSLVHFVNQTNRELAKFIDAMRNADYTTKFPTPANRSFEMLFERFKNTLLHYQTKETKYEAQFQFIQYIVNHIETGIIAFDESNRVVLSNTKAEEVRRDYFFGGKSSLVEALKKIDESGLIKSTNLDSSPIELVVFRKEVKLLDKKHTIFTFKDIKSHLATKEIESWQKLIRILAHEIINTLTPITSLAETSILLLKNNREINKDDIMLGLDTIKSRSSGLLTFMEDYRKLVKIPKPEKKEIDLEATISSMLALFQAELDQVNIKLDLKQKHLTADIVQLEQMLVNLITNAIQAFNKKENVIIISSELTEDRVILQIQDNGQGMDNDTLESALIPFYTTKSNGSGIGLSLVQQLMHAHQGNVSIKSELNKFTSIALNFPLS